MRPQSITDPDFQQRFFARMKRVPSGCLEWTGSRNRQGYGRVWCDGKDQPAHRIAWQIAHGPLPEGLDVLHKCDNPPCCDDAHLFLGTQADNNHDRDQKGREARGERQGQAKLTDADVLDIRRVYVRGSREFGTYALGQRFGVSQAQIGYVVRRELWQHI